MINEKEWVNSSQMEQEDTGCCHEAEVVRAEATTPPELRDVTLPYPVSQIKHDDDPSIISLTTCCSNEIYSSSPIVEASSNEHNVVLVPSHHIHHSIPSSFQPENSHTQSLKEKSLNNSFELSIPSSIKHDIFPSSLESPVTFSGTENSPLSVRKSISFLPSPDNLNFIYPKSQISNVSSTSMSDGKIEKEFNEQTSICFDLNPSSISGDLKKDQLPQFNKICEETSNGIWHDTNNGLKTDTTNIILGDGNFSIDDTKKIITRNHVLDYRLPNIKNNFNINEFRDTIGICEIRSTVEDSIFEFPQSNFQDNYIFNPYILLPDHAVIDIGESNKTNSNNVDSFNTLNSQILEILTDLDSVLDRSILYDTPLQNELNYTNSSHTVDDKELNNLMVLLSDEKPATKEFEQNISEIRRDLNVQEENSSYATTNENRNYSSVETISLNNIENGTSESSAIRDEETSFDVMEGQSYSGGSEHRMEETQPTQEVTRMEESRVECRRNSMRLARPVLLPGVSETHSYPPPELSLSALLFLESQEPGRYGGVRPCSASAAPRERGRRSTPVRRATSLHVHPVSETVESVHRHMTNISSSQRFPSVSGVNEVARDEVTVLLDEDVKNEAGWWGLSGAVVSCCLGPYNVCRFGLLTLNLGSNFVVQFMMLSLGLGAPLLALFTALGHALGAGYLRGWRISPLCRGLGISLLLAHILLALYYAAGLSYLLIYFRDSFVPQHAKYRWEKPTRDIDTGERKQDNSTWEIAETIPGYLNAEVLQVRGGEDDLGGGGGGSSLRFYLVFHLMVVWVAVALILTKGLASLGKVSMVVTVLGGGGLVAVCGRLVSLAPITVSLPYTSWNDFFINTQSWSAAVEEVFLTWGILAPCVWSLVGPSRTSRSQSPSRSLILPLVLTPLLLLVAASIALACHYQINLHGFYYHTTSYEKASWRVFMRKDRPPSVRHLSHQGGMLGVRVWRPGGGTGVTPLRLATELFPAAAALVSTSNMSSCWTALFYLSLVLLGTAQLASICGAIAMALSEIGGAPSPPRPALLLCLSLGLVSLSLGSTKGWEWSCLLDRGVVGVWWQCLLLSTLLAAVFLLRGRPYAGDQLADRFLPPPSACAPLLAFTWNVILPVALIVVSVVDFKMGRYRNTWNSNGADGTWMIMLLQLAPLLLVVLVAVIQTCRYVSSGPPDILDRIQLLYRPRLDEFGNVIRPDSSQNSPPAPPLPPRDNPPPPAPAVPDEEEDPPPKYTPPPSYSTATGARLAKMLRNSIRRSIRRVQRRLTMTSGERNSPAPPQYSRLEVIPSSDRPPSLAVVGFHSLREKRRVTAVEVGSLLRAQRRTNTLHGEPGHTSSHQPHPI